ncbi:MAG TPA: CoA pyrophosphatase [Flavipsychrobacter sp.]|nr:CoA pyrophosphatase [Flavipsychrobacter sp.]
MAHAPLITWLKERLQKELPGITAQERMTGRVLPMPGEIPESARQGAVLALLYPVEGVLTLLLMKRAPDNSAHSGQVSFPGGKRDPGDADLVATALREAWEEVGLHANDMEILGALSSLYIPVSNFNVHPFIAYTTSRPELKPSADEVEYIIEVPIAELFHPERITKVLVTSPADKTFIRKVPAYKLQDETVIWGATAMMISELQVLLEEYEDI